MELLKAEYQDKTHYEKIVYHQQTIINECNWQADREWASEENNDYPITSQHNLMHKIQKMQEELCDFFDSIKKIAAQLNPIDIWCRILTRSVSKLLISTQPYEIIYSDSLLRPPDCVATLVT